MRTARVAPEKAVFRPALLRAPTAGSLPEKNMATYWEKLRDPRWQRRRLEIMERAGFACEQCAAQDKTLNVHHKIYRKKADPWDYADSELACLCEQCHETEHAMRDRLNKVLALGGVMELEFTVGYAEGIYWRYQGPEPDVRIDVLSWEHAAGMAAAFAGVDPDDIIAAIDDNKQVAVTTLHALEEKRSRK